MKASELNGAVLAGGVFAVGLYLGGKAEVVKVLSKQTGQREGVVVVRETVLAGVEPLIVSTWLRDLKNVEEWKPQFKPQERVVIKVQGLQTQSGIKILSGTLESLQ
jgi:hypothetical protein